MDGAVHADADKTLSIAEGPGELTMITGDVMLSGLDSMKTQFRKTYSGIKSQPQSINQKRVRLLSQDVTVLIAVGEGTYTDKAGWTSPPVGLGLTVVFVREHRVWQAQHTFTSRSLLTSPRRNPGESGGNDQAQLLLSDAFHRRRCPSGRQ
jgi:hypothetical protein